jgi:hypothetical protein
MPAGKQTDHQPIDHSRLSDNHPGELRPEPLMSLPQFVNLLNIVITQRLWGGIGGHIVIRA